MLAVGQGEVKQGDLDVIGYGCNVADEDAVKRVFADIKQKFGRVDVLVTAAGTLEGSEHELGPGPPLTRPTFPLLSDQVSSRTSPCSSTPPTE